MSILGKLLELNNGIDIKVYESSQKEKMVDLISKTGDIILTVPYFRVHTLFTDGWQSGLLQRS